MSNATVVALVATVVVTVAAVLWSTTPLAVSVGAAGLLLTGAVWYGVHHPPGVA